VRELDGTVRPCFNRMVWDLRPSPAKPSERSSGESQAAYVPPGECAVRTKAGEFKASMKLTVEAEPGVHEGEFVAP